jgi:hypothetical protein
VCSQIYIVCYTKLYRKGKAPLLGDLCKFFDILNYSTISFISIKMALTPF